MVAVSRTHVLKIIIGSLIGAFIDILGGHMLHRAGAGALFNAGEHSGFVDLPGAVAVSGLRGDAKHDQPNTVAHIKDVPGRGVRVQLIGGRSGG